MLRMLAALIMPLFILLSFRAGAEDETVAAAGRYAMSPNEDGILRLDTKTGAVSICHRKGGSYVCETVADDLLAFEGEIARLAAENRKLKARISELEQGGAGGQGQDLTLPDKQDMDKVMSFFDEVMRRFIDMVKSLKQDSAGEKT